MSTIIAILGFLTCAPCKSLLRSKHCKERHLNYRFEFLPPYPSSWNVKVFLNNALNCIILYYKDYYGIPVEHVTDDAVTAEEIRNAPSQPKIVPEDKVYPTKYPPPNEIHIVSQKTADSYTRDDIHSTKNDISHTRDDISYTRDNIPYTRDNIPYTYEAASSSSNPQAPIHYTQPQASTSRAEQQNPPPYETLIAPQHTTAYTQEDNIPYIDYSQSYYPQSHAASASFDPWAAHRPHSGQGRRTNGTRLTDTVVRIPSVYLLPASDGTVQVIRH